MYQLNENQILAIANDVENSGINFSHLSTDLIDHVCCDIESHMRQGVSFDQAYMLVKNEFGIKGLRQIQQDTLMLIDKNYRIMKKSMKTIGVLAMAIMAFGALFKIFHWPGASIMLTISFFFTTLVFFPTLLYVMYKEINEKKQALLYIIAIIGGAAFMTGVLFKIMHWPEAHILITSGLSILTYIVLPTLLISKLKNSSIKPGILLLGFIPVIIFISGMLFKIQHWPGASILLTFGSVFLIFVFVPLYYFAEIRKSEKLRVDFIFVIIALTYFIVLSFLLQLNLSKAVYTDGVFQNNSFNKTVDFLATKNSILITDTSNIDYIKLHDASEKICQHLEELKITIAQHNSEIDRATASVDINTDHPVKEVFKGTWFLLSSNNAYSPLPQLKKDIRNYLTIYNTYADSIDTKLVLNNLFSMENNNWEEINFKSLNAGAALTKLSFWQYQIQLADYILLTESINKSKN